MAYLTHYMYTRAFSRQAQDALSLRTALVAPSNSIHLLLFPSQPGAVSLLRLGQMAHQPYTIIEMNHQHPDQCQS